MMMDYKKKVKVMSLGILLVLTLSFISAVTLVDDDSADIEIIGEIQDTDCTKDEDCEGNKVCNLVTGECEEPIIPPKVVYSTCVDIPNNECNDISPEDVTGIYVSLSNMISEIDPSMTPSKLRAIINDPENEDGRLFDDNDDCVGRIVGGGCRLKARACEERVDIVDCDFGDGVWPLDKVYSCVLESELTNYCSTQNHFLLNWTGTLLDKDNLPAPAELNDLGCSDGEKTIDCPSVENIPFFSLMNLIVSALMILGIYCLMGKRGRGC